MLCILCGAEMRLIRVQPDDTMMVKGYEYRTFECPSCQETELRLTFTHEPTPQPGQPVPADTSAPVPPAATGQDPAPPVSPDSTHHEEAVPPVSAVPTDQDRDAPPVSAAPTDQDRDAPPVAPATDQKEPAAPSRWARAVAKLRGLQERGS
jgi:hypothetical protein